MSLSLKRVVVIVSGYFYSEIKIKDKNQFLFSRSAKQIQEKEDTICTLFTIRVNKCIKDRWTGVGVCNPLRAGFVPYCTPVTPASFIAVLTTFKIPGRSWLV